MDSKSNFSAGDADMKEPVKDAEYESLLDINEKHYFPENQPETSKDEVSNIEAGHSEHEEDTAPAPRVARAPLRREEALALRIKPMDNIRTFALCLIFLQNSAIQAISAHREAVKIHETWPKMFVFISLFVGFTKVVAVPLLFFVAGFTSYFAMVMHTRSPIRFSLRRTWKTAMTVVLYQVFAHLAKLARPLPLANAIGTPYYASREGILAVLNGPTAYVIAILALDYVYASCRATNLFLSNHNKPMHFISTSIRYELAKIVLFVPLGVWVTIRGSALIRYIFPASSALEQWLYTLNSAEIHFPFLYLIAYTAGIHFVHYYKFILADAQRKGAFSPLTDLFIRLTLSLVVLYSWRRLYPVEMVPFLDVRQRPTFVFHQPLMAGFYGIWTNFVILNLVAEAMIGVFFTTSALAKDWGSFSRTAHFQVYVQMLYVVGNPVRIFDNLFMRWLLLGWIGIYYAKLGGLGTMYLRNLVKRGWSMIRRRISRDTE